MSKVLYYDLARDDMSQALCDAFRYCKLVLATTTYNADIYPFMNDFITRLTEHNFQNRTVGLIENGTWAPLAAKVMKEMLSKCKKINWLDTTVKIMSAVNRRKPQIRWKLWLTNSARNTLQKVMIWQTRMI